MFDFVADLRNEPQFNPDASNVVQKTSGTPALGTVYEEDLRGIGHYLTTIDVYDRPSQLGFDARNPRVDARVRFHFSAPAPGSTLVSCTVELMMKRAMRLFEPVMAPVIRRQIARTRGPMLKAALES